MPDTTPTMRTPTTARRLVAEGLGTALLIAIVVGSGIRAERLAAGDTALALLCNALATGAGLVALLVSLGPVSGGHFNPVVTLSNLIQGNLSPREALGYVLAQLSGAVFGVMAAHAMFGLPLLAAATQARTGPPMWWSEFLATFGLIGLGLATSRHRPGLVPFVVAGYITAGYWFTSSTSFANPALTIACALTDTFTGIRAIDASMFILAQICGSANAALLFQWLCPSPMAAASNPPAQRWQGRTELTSAD
ncbi:aquaporin [Cupriavidus metallidurans]|uniref:aquaporin n=1 Tax=Cupriavidus metallidurans TaxID=119219 RepID=UPI001CCAFE15|nr:MIP/aquaporin family protein [Cupriavidus metallidurans]UBM10942.1 aquaporin family protein [Cupriavidus metallidurans]